MRIILLVMCVLLMAGSVFAYQWVDVKKLKRGQIYSISRKTPLMPVRRLSGGWNKGMDAIHKVRYMRAGGRFMVLSADKDKTGLWYNVAVVSNVGNIEAKGWVNSTALIGQELGAQ